MLHRAKTGLVIVDVQGKLARLVADSNEVIDNCVALAQAAQILTLPIVWLEQNPEKLGATVDELGSRLVEEQPITKFTFSGCKQPRFIEAVERADVDTWLVCGIEAHICVYQTALGLHKLGYQVELVTDCVSSRTLSNKQLAIRKLEQQGVMSTSLEMALYELIEDCRDPTFRSILNLVR